MRSLRRFHQLDGRYHSLHREGVVTPVVAKASGTVELKFHSVIMVCALAEVRVTKARAAVRREDLRWFIF